MDLQGAAVGIACGMPVVLFYATGCASSQLRRSRKAGTAGAEGDDNGRPHQPPGGADDQPGGGSRRCLARHRVARLHPT